MNLEQVLRTILEEYNKASEKFPYWPTDPLHASAIVAEEAGELTRASLHSVYEGSLDREDKKKACIKEAIQTAVVAIRYLENFDRLDFLKAAEVLNCDIPEKYFLFLFDREKADLS